MFLTKDLNGGKKMLSKESVVKALKEIGWIQGDVHENGDEEWKLRESTRTYNSEGRLKSEFPMEWRVALALSGFEKVNIKMGTETWTDKKTIQIYDSASGIMTHESSTATTAY